MRILIVEDEVISLKVMQQFLSPVADCDVALNGAKAVDAFNAALDENRPYDLICMDIMMPVLDGQEALKKIREIEKEQLKVLNNGVKVIMTTALDDQVNIMKAFCQGGALSYIVKPITKTKLYKKMAELGFSVPDREQYAL